MPRKSSSAQRTRHARTARHAASAAALANKPGIESPPQGMPFDTVPGAALLQAPARLAAVWSDFAGHLQRAGQQAWQGWQRDTETANDEAARASAPQQAMGLPLEFAAEQVARWTQLSMQVATSLLDVQTGLFKDLEAVCTQSMAPWVGGNGALVAKASAQDAVEPPLEGGPAQIWWTAQRVWSESARVWLNAMSHDLQSEPARAH
jgi:hypothetical protein